MISFVLLFALAFAADPACSPVCTEAQICIYDPAKGLSECVEKPTCDPTCEEGDVCTKYNGCAPKNVCDDYVPIYYEDTNQCSACPDEKPFYNKEKDPKVCEACPSTAPVYHYEGHKCITVAECDATKGLIYDETEKWCSCKEGSEFKDNKCVPVCEEECKSGEVCQYKSESTAERHCVASYLVCDPVCTEAQICQYDPKKGLSECVEKPTCDPACEEGDVCTKDNGCAPKNVCDDYLPIYYEDSNECAACPDDKPFYNKEKDPKVCEACPSTAPVYHYEGHKCITVAECDATKGLIYIEEIKLCSCKNGEEFKNDKCVPICEEECEEGQVCQYIPGSTETHCVASYLVCDPPCSATQKCQFNAIQGVSECREQPTCDPACENGDVCTVDNGCAPKNDCTDEVPVYFEDTNQCVACPDERPIYNKEKNPKVCEACPSDKPVFLVDARICIAEADCKKENNLVYIPESKLCGCSEETGFYNKEKNLCFSGVNGLFLVLALVIFFLF